MRLRHALGLLMVFVCRPGIVQIPWADHVNERRSLPLYDALKEQTARLSRMGVKEAVVIFLGIGSDTDDARRVAHDMTARLGVPVIALPVYRTGDAGRDFWTAVGDYLYCEREVGIGYALESIAAQGIRIRGQVYFSGAGIIGNVEVAAAEVARTKYPHLITGPQLWVCSHVSEAVRQRLEERGIVAAEVGVRDTVHVATIPPAEMLHLPRLLPTSILGMPIKVIRLAMSNLDSHSLTDHASEIAEALALRPMPVFVVVHGHNTWHVLAESSVRSFAIKDLGNWHKSPQLDGWVLVGRDGAPESECVAVLVTDPDDTPQAIASKIRQRHIREHPHEQAFVLLDGDPGSERNVALRAALRAQGYQDDWVLCVWNGSLYRGDGVLICNGEGVIPREAMDDPVMAQGMWGAIIAQVTGQPVYADPVRRDEKVLVGVHGIRDTAENMRAHIEAIRQQGSGHDKVLSFEYRRSAWIPPTPLWVFSPDDNMAAAATEQAGARLAAYLARIAQETGVPPDVFAYSQGSTILVKAARWIVRIQEAARQDVPLPTALGRFDEWWQLGPEEQQELLDHATLIVKVSLGTAVVAGSPTYYRDPAWQCLQQITRDHTPAGHPAVFYVWSDGDFVAKCLGHFPWAGATGGPGFSADQEVFIAGISHGGYFEPQHSAVIAGLFRERRVSTAQVSEAGRLPQLPTDRESRELDLDDDERRRPPFFPPPPPPPPPAAIAHRTSASDSPALDPPVPSDSGMALPTYTLTEAVARGLVEVVSAAGPGDRGGICASLRIRKKTDDAFRLIIPPGMLLRSDDPHSQSLAVW